MNQQTKDEGKVIKTTTKDGQKIYAWFPNSLIKAMKNHPKFKKGKSNNQAV